MIFSEMTHGICSFSFRCVIMDDNGNINLHTDFIEKPGDIEGQHIVKKVDLLQFKRILQESL